MVESRGNQHYVNADGKHIGVEHIGSTLHFGPLWNQNGYHTATFSTYSKPGVGFNKDFHRYQMIWTPECITFCIDGIEIGRVLKGDGFWARGGFQGENIWANATNMAPFDQEVS